jgi:excisionase family DNA binding protein
MTDYQTTAEAAARLGVTPGYLRQLLVAGRIPGAVKRGRDWLIPAGFVLPADLRATRWLRARAAKPVD